MVCNVIYYNYHHVLRTVKHRIRIPADQNQRILKISTIKCNASIIKPTTISQHHFLQENSIQQYIKHLPFAQLSSTQTPIAEMRVNQSYKWNLNLPALTPEAPDFFKPFFLTMKLAPINKLEDKPKSNPFMLSDDIPL